MVSARLRLDWRNRTTPSIGSLHHGGMSKKSTAARDGEPNEQGLEGRPASVQDRPGSGTAGAGTSRSAWSPRAAEDQAEGRASRPIAAAGSGPVPGAMAGTNARIASTQSDESTAS